MQSIFSIINGIKMKQKKCSWESAHGVRVNAPNRAAILAFVFLCLLAGMGTLLAAPPPKGNGDTTASNGRNTPAKRGMSSKFKAAYPSDSTVRPGFNVSGGIRDEKSAPIAGAAITVLGQTIGAVADNNGHFELAVPAGDVVLLISAVGYKKDTIALEGRHHIDIMLQAINGDLDQIVVTGYMKQKKADLTGAISVVSAKELNKNHGVTNIMQALQGVVPGLHITTDGSPAGNTSIQIRGLTSINGASPLIVIDGVPSGNMNLRDINPNNIASMQILKDAASASIYGAQGGAGVILIETKQGEKGKAKISYNGSFGFSQFANKVKMMNTQQYGEALWQAAVNDGHDPNNSTQIYTYDWHKDDKGIPVLDKVTPIKYLNADSTMVSANTNWLDAISRLGLQNDHQVTVSGGGENSRTLFSMNYLENQGTQIYTGYKRFTARLNSSYNLLNNHLTIGENMEASHMIINDQNGMHDALVEPPIIPVHTTDGGWGGSAVNLGMDDYWNSVRGLTLNKDNNNKYNKLYGNIYANVNFMKHFNYRSQVGLIYTQGYHRTIQFTFHEGGGKFQPINNVDQWYWQESTLSFSNTLDYQLNVGKHNLDVLVGTEATKYQTENMTGNRQGLAFENYDYAYLGTASGNMSVMGGGDKYNFLSYFGKFNYSYDSRYLLSATLRDDGSSKFGANHQYGLFPAFSAGWRISQEKFMQSVKFISDLKLRGSWGMNGNTSIISSNASKTYFVADYNGTSYGIGGLETGSLPSGFRKSQTGNPDLKWESDRQTDIGLDFGLFSQRLSGSFDYYHRFTDGMLYNPPYPGVLGEGANKWYNGASMVDKGFEVQLSYNSNPGRAFKYSITGNISHNRNEIVSVPNTVLFTYGGSALKGDNIIGHPFHSYYGFVTDGLFTTQEEVDKAADQTGKGIGRIHYKDLSGPDGKPDGKIDYDYDQTWIGSSDPKVEFGLGFNASYRNFDFSMFWQGIAGSTVYNGWKSYSDFWNVWVQSGFNHPSRILGAWTPNNPTSTIPALSVANANDELRTSTYFMESGDYLKLRNIQLGYTLPLNISSSIGMEKLHIFIVALNLISIKKSWGDNAFTGPDPENYTGSSYSNPYVIPRTFKIGLDVSF